MKKLNTQIEKIHKLFKFDKENFKMKNSLLVFSMSLVSGLMQLLLSVLSTETFIHHTCKTCSLRERLRTHKVFTKDPCFTLIIISSP